MRSKILNYFALIFVAIMFALILYGFYQQYQPFKSPTVSSFKITSVKDGNIEYHISSCVYQKVPTDTSRRIQGVTLDRTYILDPSSSPGVEPGCYNKEIVLKIGDMTPGRYTIVNTAVFHVNTVKVVNKTFESEEFEVVK